MFKTIRKYYHKAVNYVSQKSHALASAAGLGVASLTLSSPASADIGSTITGAFSAAQANFGLAATGLITAVAVLTGIGLIVSLLRK